MLGAVGRLLGSPGVVPFQIGFPRLSKQVQLELDVDLGWRCSKSGPEPTNPFLFLWSMWTHAQNAEGSGFKHIQDYLSPSYGRHLTCVSTESGVEVGWFYASWFIHFAGWNWILWENPAASLHRHGNKRRRANTGAPWTPEELSQ